MKILKALGGIVVLGLLIWVILAIAEMAILLLPLAILAIGGYFAYKWFKAKYQS